MKDIKERINNLSDDDAKRLAKALDSFQCSTGNYPHCDDCPLCQEYGACLIILVENRIKYGKCL